MKSFFFQWMHVNLFFFLHTSPEQLSKHSSWQNLHSLFPASYSMGIWLQLSIQMLLLLSILKERQFRHLLAPLPQQPSSEQLWWQTCPSFSTVDRRIQISDVFLETVGYKYHSYTIKEKIKIKWLLF